MNDGINVGDIVKVVDDGRSYPAYKEWAERYNLNQWEEDNFCIYDKRDYEYKVVVRGMHFTDNTRTLVGIECLESGRQYIINIEGVKKVNNPEEELKALGKSLFGKKMRVTPETSELVQKAVFAAGGKWADCRKIIQYCNDNYLYVSKDGDITRDNSKGYFDNHRHSEVTLSVEKKLIVQEVPKVDKDKQEKLDRIVRMEEELKQLKRSVEEE